MHVGKDGPLKPPMRLEISHFEALVLFEWLVRFNETNQAKFEDDAEQQVLWKLEGLLEKALVEPFDPKYLEILAAARKRVRDEH